MTTPPSARRPLCLVCFGTGRPFVPELAALLADDFEVYRFDLAAGRVYRGAGLLDERSYGERHRTAAMTLLRHRRLLARAVVHYHFVHPLYWISRAFVPAGRSIVHFWGSDVFRIGGTRQRLQRAFIRGAARVVAPASATARAVAQRYGLPEVPVWQLGVGSLPDLAARMAAGPPVAKDTVCIGYNGFREQQHLRIVETAAAGLRLLQRDHRIVIPMTYGTPAGYADEVRAACATAGLEAEVVTAFLPHDELVDLRLRTALMLHFPVSDAFSASMQEVLVGGGVVLAGEWLAYEELADAGGDLRQLDWSGLQVAVAAFAKTGDASEALPRSASLVAGVLEQSAWSTWLPVYAAEYARLGA